MVAVRLLLSCPMNMLHEVDEGDIGFHVLASFAHIIRLEPLSGDCVGDPIMNAAAITHTVTTCFEILITGLPRTELVR